jgi:hypothetical protein
MEGLEDADYAFDVTKKLIEDKNESVNYENADEDE